MGAACIEQVAPIFFEQIQNMMLGLKDPKSIWLGLVNMLINVLRDRGCYL